MMAVGAKSEVVMIPSLRASVDTLLLLSLAAVCLESTPVVPVVDVFSRNEAGYYCIKIPSLTVLADGQLLALGEARMGSCSDYTKTDLVLKTSVDNGASWSALRVLYTANKGTAGNGTIGNAAPVIAANGDIVVPFCEDNKRVWVTRSTDNGVTWSTPVDITSVATQPSWKWVGLGPPSGLRLRGGRLLFPGYHTSIFNGTIDNGLVSKGHAMLSDDGGFRFVGSTAVRLACICS
jgi:sialidase-1